MINQIIFNDQAINLANYITDSGDEWRNFEEFLKNGGNPFHHICFSVCVVLDLIESDFLEAVFLYSTKEHMIAVEKFIEEMGE